MVAIGSGADKYDGVDVFLPEVANLRLGDIMLTLNAVGTSLKGAAVSKIITSMTSGRFSHALICLAPPTFINAIDAGVSTLLLSRCFPHDIARVRVLRHPDADVAAHAARLAQIEVGRDYSKLDAAALSVLPPRLAAVADTGIVCSALVAHVYGSAGAPEFLKTPFDRTTPATIDKLPGMRAVTDAVFPRRLSPRNVATLWSSSLLQAG